MIEERYLAATRATNLREVPLHQVGQVDLIKASGMSRRGVAAHYLRLISKPTRGDIERMHEALLQIAAGRGHADAQEPVTAAMAWLIEPRCKVCLGAGEIERKARMHKCPKCKGEKLRKEPSDRLAQDLIAYVQDCRRAHSSSIFRKLN